MTEEQKVAYLLGMCQRVEREFTLREIIARVLEERPDMMMEFPNVWGNLISHKLIKVRQFGEPNTYELCARPPQ